MVNVKRTNMSMDKPITASEIRLRLSQARQIRHSNAAVDRWLDAVKKRLQESGELDKPAR